MPLKAAICDDEPEQAGMLERYIKEWAVSSLRDGFCNRYTLDTEYLNILNLNSPDYTILNWIAVLVEHRLFSIKTPVARRAKRYLIDNFGINVNAYDLIMGYRADDSYFDYAESFLNIQWFWSRKIGL